jgi:hypothetical protein
MTTTAEALERSVIEPETDFEQAVADVLALLADDNTEEAR